MIKAAATLRTLGYLHKAMIVNRLPARPIIMMMIATTAAKVLKGFGNLWQINNHKNSYSSLLFHYVITTFINIISYN